METRKQAIMAALDAFVHQRPGLEYGNYGDVSTYRAEMRGITRDLHDYRQLAKAVEWADGITADDLLAASRSAFSGRLTITEVPPLTAPLSPTNREPATVPAHINVDYCTGQYFPTEYRKAACAVLASALWRYRREHMPAPCDHRVRLYGVDAQPGKWQGINGACAERAARGGESVCYIEDRYNLPGGTRKGSAGNWLRAYFAREFGRGMAARWFR